MRIIKGLLPCLLLAGCTAYVDTASVSVRRDGRTDIDMSFVPIEPVTQAVNAAEALDTPEARQRLADERDAADREIAEMRDCLGGNFTFDSKQRTGRLAVRDLTSAQIAVKRRCIPQLDEHADLTVERERGWLRDSLTATVKLTLPIMGSEGKGMLIHPREFRFQFEDEVEASVQRNSGALDIDFTKETDDLTVVSFKPNQLALDTFYSQQDRERDCPGKNAKCPQAEPYVALVELQFVSHQNKYSLSDILAFFSILFGSGLAVTLGSRVLAVRTEDRKPR